MIYNCYNFIGLIHPSSNADFSQLAENIKKCFVNDKRQISVNTYPDNIVIQINDYRFKVFLNDDSHVLIESKEMANSSIKDLYGQPVNKNNVQNCFKRFEIGGLEDFQMKYIDDFGRIVETMEELGGITIIPNY